MSLAKVDSKASNEKALVSLLSCGHQLIYLLYKGCGIEKDNLALEKARCRMISISKSGGLKAI